MTRSANTLCARAFAALLAAAALAACGHGKPKEDPTLAGIRAETRCAALQTTLDKAEQDGIRDYYDAAFKRMRELGCFDRPLRTDLSVPTS